MKNNGAQRQKKTVSNREQILNRIFNHMCVKARWTPYDKTKPTKKNKKYQLQRNRKN